MGVGKLTVARPLREMVAAEVAAGTFQLLPITLDHIEPRNSADWPRNSAEWPKCIGPVPTPHAFGPNRPRRKWNNSANVCENWDNNGDR